MKATTYTDEADYWTVYRTHAGCRVREHVGVDEAGNLWAEIVLSGPDLELARHWSADTGRAWP